MLLVVEPPGTVSVLTPLLMEPAEAAVTCLLTSPEAKLLFTLLNAELIEEGAVLPPVVVGATAAFSCSTTLPCVTAAVLDMAVSDAAMVAPCEALLSKVLLCDTTLAMLLSESVVSVVLLMAAAVVTAL